MSLLLEALKKAERDKLGEKKQFAPVHGNAVHNKNTAKLFSEHSSGETLELVPENTPIPDATPEQQTETKQSQNSIASQNIFLSKKNNSSRIQIGRIAKWTIFSGVSLIVMIAGAYYVWMETKYISNIEPQSNELKPDFVRQTNNLPIVSSKAKITAATEPSNITKETSALPESGVSGEISAASHSSEINKKVIKEKIAETDSGKELLTKVSEDKTPSLSSDTVETSAELSENKIQEDIQNSIGVNLYSSKHPIEIIRNPTKNEVSVELETAYQAYINGDFEIARQHYLKELKTNPRNKDVLLGLAAVATRLQHLNAAQSYYLKILELDPRDTSAIAGMSGLMQADPNQTESRIKNLLAEQPNVAALHFALGNNYVSQLRWAEAQQSFFRALSIDAANADYAFNLAVSLDHLKKNKLAEKYYRKALVLSDKGPVGFKEIQITERLNELSKQ